MSERAYFWLLTIVAVLLLVAPIRVGDLAGYDDSVYAHIAKAIVTRGDWVNIQSNGFPALEHPPGFVWMQAALFSIFGFSDFVAKLPATICGVGVVVLTWWLARRLLGDPQAAIVAMLVMLATPYFIKYAAHGMTDVPFTFLYLAAVCSWLAAEELRGGKRDGTGAGNPGWYVVVTAATAYALLTRGVVGLAVPLTLAIDLLRRPRRHAALAWGALAFAFSPLLAWYGHLYAMHGSFFWEVQSAFLRDKISGDASGVRRFTGAFEYAWMFAKSYWPWLPFLGVGLWVSARQRDRRLWIVALWAAVMYAACSVSGSRYLRYLLPAYPAFSIFATVGLLRVISKEKIEVALRWIAPAAVIAAMGVAIFPPVSMHAEEVRPIAAALKNALPEGQRAAFYDAGQPRFDETGQLQWYGDRTFWILTDKIALDRALDEPLSRVWVVDDATFAQRFSARPDATVAARSGHLVLVELGTPDQP